MLPNFGIFYLVNSEILEKQLFPSFRRHYVNVMCELCDSNARPLCVIFRILVSFLRTMHGLPQRLKSTLFEIFLNGGCPKGTRSVEKISNNIDFSL